ncbi:hypothetical protein AAULR_11650 [Lacticaseibacillus rhamnosus MTCC 5462]|nr:hypothetical protein AAULR_11650 [Lacticaseibacillus rhamnosus MTCC 5462]
MGDFTVLREVRDISTTWAWLLVLIFLPIIGFGFIYSPVAACQPRSCGGFNANMNLA